MLTNNSIDNQWMGSRRPGSAHGTYTHGHYVNKKPSPTYTSWKKMRERCNSPKSPSYQWYGAVGVRVCERWSKFINFLQDMGERPDGTTLDRINSNDDYSPGNCRWSTPEVQSNNRGCSVR